MKTPSLVPSLQEIDGSADAGADRFTLCANWRDGCNGIADRADNETLCLCDDCARQQSGPDLADRVMADR
jgi:hypothetical protein